MTLLFILSFIFCGVLTKYCIVLFKAKNIVDRPSHRRMHAEITPRGGGVAIVITFVLGFVLMSDASISLRLLPLLLIVAGISFMDDLRHVPAIVRLLTHVTVSAIVVYVFLWPQSLLHQALPIYIDYALVVLYFAGFINIYNFLDGIDGITAAESIHLSVTILLLCFFSADVIYQAHTVSIIAASILGCSASFLLYNWHPAKIFLGDVGSIALGFLLGLCLLLVATSSAKLFTSCIIACLYYIADGGVTILIRLARREKIWLPHLNHFFQQAVRGGMSHKEVVCKIAACNFCLMLLSLNALHYPIISLMVAIVIVTLLLIHFALLRS
jgi:UDP-N-acetylmuramyl pentapeptide phosphotransferase/UDP-N-acetylglucosamine-1-phosphate transferase